MWSILSALLSRRIQNLTTSYHSHNSPLVQAITTSHLAAYLASLLLALLPSVGSQHSSQWALRYKSLPFTPPAPMPITSHTSHSEHKSRTSTWFPGLGWSALITSLSASSLAQSASAIFPCFCTSNSPVSFSSQGICPCCVLCLDHSSPQVSTWLPPSCSSGPCSKASLDQPSLSFSSLHTPYPPSLQYFSL